MFKTLLGAAAALAVLAASPANAVTVLATDVGATGTTNLQGYASVNNVDQSISGLTGQLTLTYTGRGTLANPLDLTVWNFAYTVKNTSSGNTTGSSIGSFGLNTAPNVSGATSTGLFDTAILNPSFPNVHGPGGIGANIIEMCFATDSSSCNGDGNTLVAGASTSGTFSLDFDTVMSSIELTNAYLRFQAVNSTSPNIRGGSGVGFNVGDVVINPLTPGTTPVPGAVWLFGSVLAAVFGGKKLRPFMQRLALRRRTGLATA